MINPYDPNYIFFDEKAALDAEDIDPLPPYSQDPVFHDIASYTSTSKLSRQRLCEVSSLTIVIATLSTAHDTGAREEVIPASFPYEDENMDESLLDARVDNLRRRLLLQRFPSI